MSALLLKQVDALDLENYADEEVHHALRHQHLVRDEDQQSERWMGFMWLQCKEYMQNSA